MKPNDEFDEIAAIAAKEEAITQVIYGAPDAWKRRALMVVRAVCCEMNTFTTDDVWKAMAVGGAEPSDVEPRALGAIMQSASKVGWCEKASDLPHRLSVRKNCHRRPLQVWRSKLKVK